MISNKWLELYQYIKSSIEGLPTHEVMVEKLNDKLMFLSAQFVDEGKVQSKKQTDWLEHEAFTLVLSEVLSAVFEHALRVKLTKSQLSFLFETFMAAQLCQLAMVTVNIHKSVLSEDDFKRKCGSVFLQLGDYSLAKTAFEASISENPANPMTHCHLGFTFLYQGETDLAIECFERSIEVDPKFVGGYQNLAGLYYQDANFTQSAHFSELAFSQNPSLVSTYITAISSYLALDLKEKAEEWIQAALENDVSSMELVRLAGICAHQYGRLDEAAEAFEHYLTFHPSSFDVLNIRAHVYAELERYEDLENDINQLLVFEPHNEWCLEHLFLCYFHNEKWADAQQVMVQLNKLAAHYKLTYHEALNTIHKKLSLDILEIH